MYSCLIAVTKELLAPPLAAVAPRHILSVRRESTIPSNEVTVPLKDAN